MSGCRSAVFMQGKLASSMNDKFSSGGPLRRERFCKGEDNFKVIKCVGINRHCYYNILIS